MATKSKSGVRVDVPFGKSAYQAELDAARGFNKGATGSPEKRKAAHDAGELSSREFLMGMSPKQRIASQNVATRVLGAGGLSDFASEDASGTLTPFTPASEDLANVILQTQTSYEQFSPFRTPNVHSRAAKPKDASRRQHALTLAHTHPHYFPPFSPGHPTPNIGPVGDQQQPWQNKGAIIVQAMDGHTSEVVLALYFSRYPTEWNMTLSPNVARATVPGAQSEAVQLLGAKSTEFKMTVLFHDAWLNHEYTSAASALDKFQLIIKEHWKHKIYWQLGHKGGNIVPVVITGVGITASDFMGHDKGEELGFPHKDAKGGTRHYVRGERRPRYVPDRDAAQVVKAELTMIVQEGREIMVPFKLPPRRRGIKRLKKKYKKGDLAQGDKTNMRIRSRSVYHHLDSNRDGVVDARDLRLAGAKATDVFGFVAGTMVKVLPGVGVRYPVPMIVERRVELKGGRFDSETSIEWGANAPTDAKGQVLDPPTAASIGKDYADSHKAANRSNIFTKYRGVTDKKSDRRRVYSGNRSVIVSGATPPMVIDPASKNKSGRELVGNNELHVRVHPHAGGSADPKSRRRRVLGVDWGADPNKMATDHGSIPQTQSKTRKYDWGRNWQ